MDIVVRTPHGDADVALVAVPDSATVADLIRSVTGQAAPTTARLDSRLVPTTTSLADSRLRIGSLVDTRPEVGSGALDESTPVVDLLQIAGRGAGRVVPLAAGRHRIGSARRVHVPELERGVVESHAFDLVVDESGTVDVVPGPGVESHHEPYVPSIGRELLDGPHLWTNDGLDVGGRIFQIARTSTAGAPTHPPARVLGSPDASGVIGFHRAPPPRSDERPLVVGAVRAAATAGDSLWQQRTADGAAVEVPIGLHRNGVTSITVDLRLHDGVAIVGSERFAAASARALLVELTTLYGPADIHVAIASDVERIGAWGWAHWLPHTRRCGPAAPADVVGDSAALSALGAALDVARSDDRLSILIIDDLSLWTRRDSPLRPLLTAMPEHVRVIALCGAMHEAPGICTALLEEIPPADGMQRAAESTGGRPPAPSAPALLGSLADLHLRDDSPPRIISDVRPALVEPSIASEVARCLAPLDDLDAASIPAAERPHSVPTLADLATPDVPFGGSGLYVAVGTETLDRAARPRPATEAGAGSRVAAGAMPGGTTQRPAIIELSPSAPTVVVCADDDHHDVTVAAIVLGAVSQRPVASLSVLLISDDEQPWHAEIPHIAARVPHADGVEPSRLIHRLLHVLTANPLLDLLVVIEHAPPDADGHDPLIRGLHELGSSLDRIHLVVASSESESESQFESEAGATRSASSLADIAGTTLRIGRDGRGSIVDSSRSRPFLAATPAHLADSDPRDLRVDTNELVVAPVPHGRPLTSLERRLERLASEGDRAVRMAPSTTAAVARHVVADHARYTTPDHAPVALLPVELPSNIDARDLIDRHPEGGVPLGLLDRPEFDENDIYRWQPGAHGSLLAVGSPRSGMIAVLDLLIAGIAARMSPDDLHVYAIEVLPQRRRAIRSLPHTGSVVSPDDTEAVVRLVAGLHALMKRRVADGRGNGADVLVMIGDIGRITRSLPPSAIDEATRQLGELAASGARVGIDMVAVATRGSDVGGLQALTGDRLIGMVADSTDRIHLGAPGPTGIDRVAGRCWSTSYDRRVQLATPSESIEHDVALVAPQPATHRPPVDIAAGFVP